jgi:hypothetical protein
MPSAPISVAARAVSASSSLEMTTRARSIIACAMARPMPRVEPVTIATLPVRSNMVILTRRCAHVTRPFPIGWVDLLGLGFVQCHAIVPIGGGLDQDEGDAADGSVVLRHRWLVPRWMMMPPSRMVFLRPSSNSSSTSPFKTMP